MSVILCRTLARRLFAISFLVLSLCLPARAQKPTSGTTPFVLDGNRIYAEVSFVLPTAPFAKPAPSRTLAAPPCFYPRLSTRSSGSAKEGR